MTHPDPRVRQGERRRRFPRRWNERVFDVPRRYTYGIPAVLLLVMGLFGIWAFWLEPSSLVVRRRTMTVGNWPAVRPLRVALLADIHGGSPYTDRDKIKTVVALTNRQKPDLVALMGDNIVLGVLGGVFMTPAEVADALRGLEAPLGVYAVLGNHDWWYNGEEMAKALEGVGYRVLLDDVAKLDFEGQTIYLAGLEDEWTRRPDAAKVMGQVPPGAPVIVLTHNPDLFPKLPPVNGVVLAAHTHGGQVRVPFMGAPIVPSRYRQRYARGLVRSGDQQMFVTSGIGTSVLPVRFRVPPEIAVIEIRPPATLSPATMSPASPSPARDFDKMGDDQ